jgi:hypothetical protein
MRREREPAEWAIGGAAIGMLALIGWSSGQLFGWW